MSPASATIVVTVKPGAKVPGIVFGSGDAVTVRVRERAVEGKANEAARAAIADAIGVRARDVTLVRGSKTRLKAFAVAGLTSAEILAKLRRSQDLRP